MIILACLLNMVMTALAPPAFAVYSESRELLLCKRYDKPFEGDIFEGREVKYVFEVDEDARYGSYSARSSFVEAPWHSEHYIDPLSVAVLDMLHPRSCAGWFEYFSECSSFDLAKLDTRRCESFESMFKGCDSLVYVHMDKQDTSKCKTVSGMFWGCGNLRSVDLGSCDFSACADFSDMFYACSNLTTLSMERTDFHSGKDFSGMFEECSFLRLNCSEWNVLGAEDARRFRSDAFGVIQPDWPESCSSDSELWSSAASQ